MSMLEKFFSVNYADRSDLFRGLSIWEEKELADTVKDALRQIEEKNYQADIVEKGIPREHIRRYGFAFCGKKVLIGSALQNNGGAEV